MSRQRNWAASHRRSRAQAHGALPRFAGLGAARRLTRALPRPAIPYDELSRRLKARGRPA